MKTTKIILLLLALVLIISPLNAQFRLTSSRVRIHAKTAQQKTELVGLLQLDHYVNDKEGNMIAEITNLDLASLKASGIPYDILVNDLATALHKANKKALASRLPFEQTGSTVASIIPKPAAFEVKSTFGGYYQLSEMIAAMDAVVSTYGGANGIVRKFSIGQSFQGRDIWCMEISDNAGQNSVDEAEIGEQEVLFMGLQHAREAIGGASMVYLMQYLCENYAGNARVRELVNNRKIFIIICMNPDGWQYNYDMDNDGGYLWRKNRRGNGTDLNRNWGVDWGNCSAPINPPASSCGSNTSTAETYYGTSAFSEPETRAVRDFTLSRRLVAMIDQHAFGPYYSLPYGRPSLPSHTLSTKDNNFYTYISGAMGTYNGMRAGNSYEALSYEVAGGVKDWMLEGQIGAGIGNGLKGRIYGMTGEGGFGTNDQDLSTPEIDGTFWPPNTKIISLCQGMVFQDIQLLAAAGPLIDLQDGSDPVISTKSGTLNFRATRTGVANDNITVSLLPLENVWSGGSTVIPATSVTNYFDVYTGTVPFLLPGDVSNGQRLKFIWQIQAGGITYYDTVVKYYHTVPATLVLAEDNMEGVLTTKWTKQSGNWGYTPAGSGFAEQGSGLSESPAANTNYSQNENSILRWTAPLNLSASTSAQISFWTKFRAENFHDKLQVQVSNNSTTGTNGTWTPIVGSTTIQEPGTLEGSTINGQPALTGLRPIWTREVYDLKNYIGTGNSNVRFRLVFTSDATTTSDFKYREDDGFYIDSFKLVSTTAALTTLPVKFISFKGQLLSNETIDLKWQAEVDNNQDHFEVEKSSDGLTFIYLGSVTRNEAYQFIDHRPYSGNNFYRIKSVDKNGEKTYSSVINVPFASKFFNVQIFPNPVTADAVNVRVNSVTSERFNVRISDLSGRVITDKTISSGFDNKITFNERTTQLYILTVRNSKGMVVATQKLAVSERR